MATRSSKRTAHPAGAPFAFTETRSQAEITRTERCDAQLVVAKAIRPQEAVRIQTARSLSREVYRARSVATASIRAGKQFEFEPPEFIATASIHAGKQFEFELPEFIATASIHPRQGFEFKLPEVYRDGFDLHAESGSNSYCRRPFATASSHPREAVRIRTARDLSRRHRFARRKRFEFVLPKAFRDGIDSHAGTGALGMGWSTRRRASAFQGWKLLCCASDFAENGERFEVRCWIAIAPFTERQRAGSGDREAVVETINGQTVGDGAVFAGAAGVEGVFGFEACVLRDEARLGRDEGGVFGGAIGDVGLDEEGAAWDEHATELRQEVVRDDEPLGVALFPPRIGEVHEDGARTRGGETREGDARVFGEHARAATEAAFAHAVVDDGRPFAANF